ncbi:MAG: peptide-methionine (S)-S-oxide reductase [bacterium]|nr:peptide-methionine (S)-S-oxide reductase [bacterium]
MESQFGIIEGVIRTRVGYAGGNTDSPTYRSMGDHTETVQVDFDPKKVTYRQLLDIFWNSHRYTQQTGIPQYKNAIFYHNADQRQQALASKDALEQSSGKTVRTDIVSLKSFTLAEDYHQKYLFKHSALKHFLDKFYTRHADLVDSTAAARLNGYAGKNGTKEQFLRELQSLGMSEEGKKVLKELVIK